MRSGFTLIEVLAAVAIASIAGIAMLKMNSSNLFFFDQLRQYSQIQETLSIAGFHGTKSDDRSDKTLYAMLETSYTIDNDDLRHYLKSQTYSYSERVVDTVSFDSDALFSEEDGGTQTETVSEVDMEKAASVPLIQFELVAVTLKDKTKHGTILQVRTMEE